MRFSRFGNSRVLCVLLIGAFSGTLAGCGGKEPIYKGDKRYAISGTVTFNGEPVHGAMISFVPQDDKLNPSGGPVENGKFSVSEEKGPNKGNYLVAITWMKPTGEKKHDSDTGEMIDVVAEAMPPKVVAGTEFSATVSDDPAQNVFTFDVKAP